MRALFGNKLFVCGLLALAILVPLEMIEGLARERQARHAEVDADIARSASGPQIVSGPVLVVPCQETYTADIAPTPQSYGKTEKRTADCTTYTLPGHLKINGEVTTEIRKRGIYSALTYSATLRSESRFNPPQVPTAAHADGVLTIGTPFLSVGVSDPRGLAGAPGIDANGRARTFAPGSRLKILGAGIHTELTESYAALNAPLEVVINLRLNGMRQLEFLPLGRATEVAVRSTWPHPSFSGNALPIERKVDDTGFAARWASSFLATNIEEHFREGMRNKGMSEAIFANAFGVSFIPAVDVYLKSERAIKYGLLFVGITFLALLLTEVLRRLRIHPLQYLMVGVALAVFFLLVLALSEHIGFALAYIAASAACVSLLSFYLAHFVGDHRLARGFGVVLSAFYAALYGLLSSEDYALLLGSLLVFGVVAATMILTRRIDWYGVTERVTP